MTGLGDTAREHFRQRSTGLVRRMDDSTVAVPAFHGEVKFAELVICLVFSQVKIHSLRYEPVHGLPTPADGEVNCWLVAKPCACAQRVVDMRLHRVAIMEYCGHAALCPEGRAGAQLALGEHSHA